MFVAQFEIMQGIAKGIVKGIEYILDRLIVLLMIGLVLCVFLQVIFRFSSIASPWTEEIARFLFVYITFLGSVVAVKEGSHIVIDVFVEWLPPNVQRVTKIVFGLVTATFLLMLIYGSVLTLEVNKEVTAASLTWFKMTYVYISVLISGILMLGYVLQNTWNLIANSRDNGLDKSKGGEPV